MPRRDKQGDNYSHDAEKQADEEKARATIFPFGNLGANEAAYNSYGSTHK